MHNNSNTNSVYVHQILGRNKSPEKADLQNFSHSVNIDSWHNQRRQTCFKKICFPSCPYSKSANTTNYYRAPPYGSWRKHLDRFHKIQSSPLHKSTQFTAISFMRSKTPPNSNPLMIPCYLKHKHKTEGKCMQQSENTGITLQKPQLENYHQP